MRDGTIDHEREGERFLPNRELVSSLPFESKEARTLACDLGLKGIGLHWI